MQAITIALGALACATPYQPQGFTGGFSEARLDANTVRVSFRGNGYTQRERVENFLHYRCAELTLDSGFDYFIIVDATGDSRQGAYTTSGYYSGSTSVSTYGNNTYAHSQGTYTPGQTYTWTKHGASAVIKMFNGEKPDDLHAYKASEAVQYMAPYVK